MESKTNSIVYSLYLEYTGRKTNILDSAVMAKASTEKLKEDEKVYALIAILKLYVFVGYYPVFEDILSKKILMKTEKGDEIEIDISTFNTEKDKAVEILKALAMQKKFVSVEDKKLALFSELKSFYDNGKEFESMLNTFLNNKDISKKELKLAISKLNQFLSSYDNADNEVEVDDNTVDLVMSEVKKELEEIL